MSPAPDASPADPAAQAAELAGRVDAATQRLLQTAGGITDEQARAASLLPGWSRGHVLTHVARNADSLRNLLIWARTGVETPQYPNVEARDAGISEGAGRPAADLIDDVGVSSAALAAEAAILADADWAAQVRGMGGRGHPAWYTLWRRLTEVEFHHVDLDAGYQPDQWPEEFALQSLEGVTEQFSRKPDCPAALLVSLDSGRTHRIGPADTEPTAQVSGPTRALLAWLTGRAAGAGLTTEPAGPLPSVPAW
jgi:maleylpyruvate isomerase